MSVARKKWYALYTRPRWEKRVFEDLIYKGIDTYLPLIKTLKQWSDRKKMVEEPLFHSYIFVHITPTEHDRALQTMGVVRFVTFKGIAVAIPHWEIEAVKAYVGEGTERMVYTDDIHIGDPVEVVFGTMKGLKGRLAEMKGKKRVLVEITGLGERLLVNIPTTHIQRTTS